jgi:hypothetical protein
LVLWSVEEALAAILEETHVLHLHALACWLSDIPARYETLLAT